METRRQAIILLAAAPLLTTEAPAQDRNMINTLFKNASDYLNDPRRVREKYATLPYYLELLRQFPPKTGGFKPEEHLRDAATSYRLLGEAIGKSEAKFDRTAGDKLLQDLMNAYEKFQPTLWEYLKQVGIEPKSAADLVLEQAIASMMLFYGAATGALSAAQIKLCIFPFCFGKPA